MTETRRWLEMRRRELMRRTAGAGVLLTLGLVLLMLALGVVLGRLGAYQRVPAAVLLGWMAVGGAVAQDLAQTTASTRYGGGAFLNRMVPAVYAAPVFFHYINHFA